MHGMLISAASMTYAAPNSTACARCAAPTLPCRACRRVARALEVRASSASPATAIWTSSTSRQRTTSPPTFVQASACRSRLNSRPKSKASSLGVLAATTTAYSPTSAAPAVTNRPKTAITVLTDWPYAPSSSSEGSGARLPGIRRDAALSVPDHREVFLVGDVHHRGVAWVGDQVRGRRARHDAMHAVRG